MKNGDDFLEKKNLYHRTPPTARKQMSLEPIRTGKWCHFDRSVAEWKNLFQWVKARLLTRG